MDADHLEKLRNNNVAISLLPACQSNCIFFLLEKNTEKEGTEKYPNT